MADSTVPGFTKAPLGNHRYRTRSKHAVVELIPTQRPDYWHVAVFRGGYLRASYQPKVAAMLPQILGPLGLAGEWEGRWHWPYDRNPYLDVQRRGFVYYIEAEEVGLTKIGTSRNVRARLGSLQDDVPFDLRLIFTCTGGTELESSLHRRYAEHRKRGEWFRSTPDLMSFTHEIQDAELLYGMLAVPWQEPPSRGSAAKEWAERQDEYAKDPQVVEGGSVHTVGNTAARRGRILPPIVLPR